MKARLLCALGAALALVIGITGAAPAEADAVVDIPDHDLRLCMTRHLGLAADATLTASRLAGMTHLLCNDSADLDLHVSSLVGLEHLTNVRAVWLGPGHVTDLSPVAGLSSLSELVLSGHRVADLAPLSGLTTLRYLDVSGNPVKSLTPLVSLPNLADLDIHATLAANLDDLQSMPSLDCLVIGEITSADYSILGELADLRCLSVDDHTITSLAGIPVPPLVTTLQIWAPKVTTLTGVEKASNLERLLAGGKSGEPAALADISALSGLNRLIDVEIGAAQVERISSLAHKPDLDVFIANDNQIVDLSPLESSTKLRRIEIFSNRVADLTPLSGMHQLIELAAPLNRIGNVEAVRGMPELQTLELMGNQVSDVSPLAHLSKLKELYLGNNSIRDISPLKDITAQLRLDNQRLSAPIEVATGVAVPLGIRNLSGEVLCATDPDPRVACEGGQITYPSAGTYQSTFTDPADSTWSGFSGTVTQRVRAQSVQTNFSKTQSPTLTGTPVVGSSLDASTKPWAPAVSSYTYQWYRGTAITGSGEGTAHYDVVAADLGKRLTVCVTGHLDGFEATRRCSKPTAPIARGHLTTSHRPLVAGSAVTDSLLTAVAGTWDDGVTLRYQWQRNHKNIKGATSSSYRLRAGDVDDRIRLRVTGSKPGYHSVHRYSTSVKPKRADLQPVSPQITGSPMVGQKLTVSPGTWKPSPVSLRYQWYRNGKAIRKATKASYLLTPDDLGAAMTVKVTGRKAGYNARSSISVPVPVVA